MRTVMTTRTLEDGTLVVGFWPPVGCWLRHDDVELRVWHRRPDGVFVDLFAEKSSRGIFPRLCKLGHHSPMPPAVIEYAHHIHDDGRCFYAVSQLSVLPTWVLPTWPNRRYRDEGDQLLLLGGAHEVARRHDEEVRRCAAARRIQSVWREASACPERAVCRRRLLREFDDMT
jgi:hypothetical protein